MKISNTYTYYPQVNTQKANFNKTAFKGNSYQVPKYLYHITSKNNYDIMKLTKKIQANKEQSTNVKGVFAFDMENFLKHWNINDSNGTPLDRKLFDRASLTGDIVLLRISTDKLDKNLFKIRSQNIIFDNEIQYKQLPNLEGEERVKCLDIIKSNKDHINNAVDVSQAQEYIDKNHAIEFIYPNDIPIDDIEFVGQANLYDFFNTSRSEYVPKIMSKLTEGEE